MKSTITTMTFSLGGLCLIVGAALALVNNITADPIAKASEKTRAEAIARILPPFDSEITEAVANGLPVFAATMLGEPVGLAVQTYTDEGFGGRFSLMVGFGRNGDVTGYQVLSHAETPGLGAKMDTWFQPGAHSIVGSQEPLKVKADGGDIDAITGATITSRAFVGAVNRARKAYDDYVNNSYPEQ